MHKRTNIARIFGALLVLLLACPLLAQQVGAPPNNAAQIGLRLDVDKRQVQVGESLHLTIEFRRMGSSGMTVLRNPAIASLQLFEVRGTSSSTQVMMDNQQTVEISSTKVTLVATRAGIETLGPAVMVFQDPTKGPQELKSNGVLVTVVEKPKFNLFAKKPTSPPVAVAQQPVAPTPPPAPQDDIRDLRPLIAGIGWALRTIFWLIVLVLVGWWVGRKVKKWMADRAKVVPVKTESSILREKLRALSADGMTARDFCISASELMRECLQVRYGILAPDLTTREVLQAMKKMKATLSAIEDVKMVLGTCDRVLYADGSLLLKEKQTLKSSIGEYIPKV